jgi:hypothetical protein
MELSGIIKRIIKMRLDKQVQEMQKIMDVFIDGVIDDDPRIWFSISNIEIAFDSIFPAEMCQHLENAFYSMFDGVLHSNGALNGTEASQGKIRGVSKTFTRKAKGKFQDSEILKGYGKAFGGKEVLYRHEAALFAKELQCKRIDKEKLGNSILNIDDLMFKAYELVKFYQELFGEVVEKAEAMYLQPKTGYDEDLRELSYIHCLLHDAFAKTYKMQQFVQSMVFFKGKVRVGQSNREAIKKLAKRGFVKYNNYSKGLASINSLRHLELMRFICV